MLLKKLSTNSDIALTLTEKSTLSEPIYLFEFINKATKVSYTCICTDLATETQKVRVNLFEIIEGVDDRLNGSLILGYSGQYEYIIYEQESTINLDTSLAVGIVERGEMRLIKDIESNSFVEYDFEINYIEYE